MGAGRGVQFWTLLRSVGFQWVRGREINEVLVIHILRDVHIWQFNIPSSQSSKPLLLTS